MKSWKISYEVVITEEDLEAFECEDLEDYLWTVLRPEGDEWSVQEIENKA